MNGLCYYHLRKLSTINYISNIQLRFYRGRPLTSYQKSLSKSLEKEFLFEHIAKDPSDLVVNASIKRHICEDRNINSDVSDTDNNKRNSYLKKVSEAFMMCEDEYKKMIFYGSENKDITKSDFFCHGCGSNINCASVYNAGYIPYEIYNEHCSDSDFMKSIRCIRCFYLEENLDPIDVSLDNNIYSDVLLKKIKQCPSATIILLADVSDLPWSVPSNLREICLSHVRLIVVGNKLDLLPQKGDFRAFYTNQLKDALEMRGISNELVSFVELISATECTGIDNLIDRVLSIEFYKNEPIFLVGSTNSGKSTIFNRLLKSDLCKTIAKGNVQEALVSNWPGTTLNVLKFPMVNLSKELKIRRENAKVAIKCGMINSAVEAKDNLLDSGQIIHCHKQPQSGQDLVTYSYINNTIRASDFGEHEMRLLYDNNYSYDESKITTKKWCYDTPGFINPDQLINYLPKNDVDSLGDRDMIKTPRIYVLRSGFSMIMQNLARLDVVQAEKQIYLTVHGVLPVEIVRTEDIEQYFQENDHFTLYSFKKNLSSSLLAKIRSKMPSYDPEIHSIPDLMSTEFEIMTKGFEISSDDVVLSSIGWVAVSGGNGDVCKIRAWTPASIGCCLRSPALVPFSIKRKGKRKGYSREFLVE